MYAQRVIAVDKSATQNVAVGRGDDQSVQAATVAQYFVCGIGYLRFEGLLARTIFGMTSQEGGEGAKYTKSRRPVQLVYSEILESKSLAMKRECEIKKLLINETESKDVFRLVIVEASKDSKHKIN